MDITPEEILRNKDNPEILEELYQSNKKVFSGMIKTLHEQESNIAIDFWYARLFYKPPNKKHGAKKYAFTAFLIILAWAPIRLAIERYFNFDFKGGPYLFNAMPVIFSLALSLFFMFDMVKIKNILMSMALHAALYAYLVLLPDNADSQSVDNAFYFGFVILWFFILFAHSGCDIKSLAYAAFLEKFGEAVIWSIIFIIGGALMVGLSLALFRAIDVSAWEFYFKNIVPLGLTSSPFVSLLVIENNNRARLAVITSNIFLPLILISIVCFGIISGFSQMKPYDDRDIFILYNVMMVIVISVLAFSSINDINNKFVSLCSGVLPIVTAALDFVTISAVIYRLSKYGVTANKITLLGTNLVMLGHLAYMIYLRFKRELEKNVNYLPVYLLWSACVVFAFPFVFKMR